MRYRHDLINKISNEIGLNSIQLEEFKNLVISWESGLNTITLIEPDDKHSGDMPCLEKLVVENEQYDNLYKAASDTVKKAFALYLKQRNIHLSR